MTPVRTLGLCGLIASALLMFSHEVGVMAVPGAGAVMLFANLQALLRKESK